MRFEAKFFNMQLAFQGKASLLFAAVVLALGAAATAAVCGGVCGFLRGALGSFLAGLAGIAVLGLVLFVGAACHMRVLLSKSKNNLGPGSTGSANSLPSLAADMQNGG
jgi:hypothetical protein